MILTLYHFLQLHPLYWQATTAMLATSGLFDFLKHKIELEGKARLTAWLSLIGTLTVLLHMAIVGVPVLSALGFLKLTAQQTIFYLGALNLIYNFIVSKVVRFLQDAKAQAADSNPDTPIQKNQSTKNGSAVDMGVVQF